jgi:hypothetical protein
VKFLFNIPLGKTNSMPNLKIFCTKKIKNWSSYTETINKGTAYDKNPVEILNAYFKIL